MSYQSNTTPHLQEHQHYNTTQHRTAPPVTHHTNTIHEPAASFITGTPITPVVPPSIHATQNYSHRIVFTSLRHEFARSCPL
ncbi:hypothetical protein E2C01_095382 [Portunus trituberculatus]|uniref:Uncharacterized protein n=1 Tax=Portunus trituberculatus TaxID=210409 RepID=A0A5B7JZ92_PORTR|nr:hypothetical protein [Portunus trituberculatus]